MTDLKSLEMLKVVKENIVIAEHTGLITLWLDLLIE